MDLRSNHENALTALASHRRFAKEAADCGLTDEAALIEAEADQMDAALAGFPALEAACNEANAATKEAYKRCEDLNAAHLAGRARRSEADDARSDLRIAQQRLEDARTAAASCLNQVRTKIGRETSALITRARENIEGVVNAALSGERQHIISADSRLHDESAPYEKIFVLRAMKEYPKLAAGRRDSQPIEQLRYCFVRRARRQQGLPALDYTGREVL